MADQIQQIMFVRRGADLDLMPINRRLEVFNVPAEFPAGARIARVTTGGCIAAPPSAGQLTGSFVAVWALDQRNNPIAPRKNIAESAHGFVEAADAPPNAVIMSVQRVVDGLQYTLLSSAQDGESISIECVASGSIANCPEGTEFAVTAQPAVNPARFTAFAAPPGMTGGKAGDDPLPDGRILLVCNSICFVGIVEGGSSRIVVEAACTTASGNGSSLIGGTSDAWFLLVEDLGPVTVGGL